MADTKTITFAGFEVKDEAKGEVAAKIATLEVIDKDGTVVIDVAVGAGRCSPKLPLSVQPVGVAVCVIEISWLPGHGRSGNGGVHNRYSS